MATILIVEDHALSRQVLYSLFSHMGHRVLEAPDPLTALTLVQGELPDLIISDILLPTMDGIELTRKLRATPSLQETPIIFYTATCRLPEDLRLSSALGTCYVIPKPSDPGFILQTVHDILGISPGQTANMRLQADFFQNAGLRLAVLMDLCYSLVAHRNQEQLLSGVSRAISEFLGCRHSLLVIEDQQGEKRFFLGQRGDKSVFSDLPLPPEVLAYVRKELQPVCWHMPDQVGGIQGCPALVLPFASPRSVYGWICLLGKGDAAAFTSEDEEIAMMLSNKGALAYENILLIEQLQKSEEYLEDLVRERTAELEKAKNELVKIEKLESLGVLAGGIAHDFNNALTAIIGHIQLAKIKTDSGEEVFTNLDLAEAACVNAQSLTRQLLTFAKGGQPLKKTAALPALIKDTVINALKDSNIRSTFSFPADLALVEIDQGQIKQVITNLVLNARQALSASGNISISAMNIRVSSGAASPLIPGKYVKLSIADQGEGIAPEHLANIFDPYFTTKEKGNGLGLATAYSIVKNHDGHITVESKAGVGTTFHILLPALEQARFCTPTGQQKSNRQGRILLIEDHELIAQSLAELLRLYGYEVDAVADGRDGLKLYLENMEDGRKYDAVIMDLTIPGGMGGKETIQHLRKIDPDVAAIVASGYSNDPVMSNFREYGFCSALPKPYKIEDMVRELQRIHS